MDYRDTRAYILDPCIQEFWKLLNVISSNLNFQVFSKSTGVPILGVVNQPFAFYDESTKNWTGKIHWGCLFKDQSLSNLQVLNSFDCDW